MSNNTRKNNRNARTQSAKFDRVVIWVDVTQKGGVVALRAMNGWYHEHASTTIEITPADFRVIDGVKLTGDNAKLIAVVKALKVLQAKLPKGKKAAYSVHIIQSSNNVDGWLNGTMERKAETVVLLNDYISRLSTCFREIHFLKRSTGVIKNLIAEGIKPQTTEMPQADAGNPV